MKNSMDDFKLVRNVLNNNNAIKQVPNQLQNAITRSDLDFSNLGINVDAS